MLERILSWGLSHEAATIIIAALPVVELRGALPMAINLFHMEWYKAFYLALVGNMLPVPILLLFLDALAGAVSRVPVGQRMVNRVFDQTRRRGTAIEKYERIGLTLFVAIPLPFTGAWTGSIAAFLLRLKFRYAFLSILAGVVIAGAIITSLCLLGWAGALIAGVALSTLAVLGWWRKD
jgi:uncharacterized membrane protein